MDERNEPQQIPADTPMCGALNPGSGPLAPCTQPLGHVPVKPWTDGGLFAHFNGKDAWGDVLPDVWDVAANVQRCTATTDDDGYTEYRCVFAEGHPVIWIEGNRWAHAVPGLVSWNVNEEVRPPAARGLGALLNEAIADGSLKVGTRTFEVGCSDPDCKRCNPKPPASGPRMRLFPLPLVNPDAPAYLPPFALLVDGYANAADAEKWAVYWNEAGGRMGAHQVIVLPGRIELFDLDGAQYGD